MLSWSDVVYLLLPTVKYRMGTSKNDIHQTSGLNFFNDTYTHKYAAISEYYKLLVF